MKQILVISKELYLPLTYTYIIQRTFTYTYKTDKNVKRKLNACTNENKIIVVSTEGDR